MRGKLFLLFACLLNLDAFSAEFEHYWTVRGERIQSISSNHNGDNSEWVGQFFYETQSDVTEILSIDIGKRISKDRLGEPGSRDNSYHSDVSKPNYIDSTLKWELRHFHLNLAPERCVWQLDSCEITLGKQRVTWGQADELKILDVVNPRSYERFNLDASDDAHIPLWMVNLELGKGDHSVQLLWAWDTTSHILPASDSAYRISTPIWLGKIPTIDAEMPFTFTPYSAPAISLKNSDAGIKFDTFLAGWDMSLHYLYHLSDLPKRYVSVSPDQISIYFETPRQQMLGLSLSNTFGSLAFRSELAYTLDQTHASDLSPVAVAEGDEVALLTGFDWHGFSDGFLSVQLVFSHFATSDYSSNRDMTDVLSTALYQHHFLNETLLFKWRWAHNAKVGDGLHQTSIGYDVSDEMRVGL
ncbi:MAG: hypothetical protein OXE99_03355, partial [Cellvibrionales bacterium]|nr:hypothetical protein [Cellvibrionales bacterium]